MAFCRKDIWSLDFVLRNDGIGSGVGKSTNLSEFFHLLKLFDNETKEIQNELLFLNPPYNIFEEVLFLDLKSMFHHFCDRKMMNFLNLKQE